MRSRCCCAWNSAHFPAAAMQSEINLRHHFLADSVSTLARPAAPPARVRARKTTVPLLNEQRCRDLPHFFPLLLFTCATHMYSVTGFGVDPGCSHVMCYQGTFANPHTATPPQCALSTAKKCTVIAGRARISSSSVLPRVSPR